MFFLGVCLRGLLLGLFLTGCLLDLPRLLLGHFLFLLVFDRFAVPTFPHEGPTGARITGARIDPKSSGDTGVCVSMENLGV